MSTAATTRTPQDAIVRLRGQSVILDADLAALYGVPVKRLNQQITRNQDRFPDDFCFQLTESEWRSLRLQNATSNGRGGRRYMPYARNEQTYSQMPSLTSISNPDLAETSKA